MTSNNPFNVPPQGFYFSTGSKTTITWKPTTDDTVTIELMNMSKSSVGTVIAHSIPNSGSFTYTPPVNIDSGTSYMLEIIDDGNPDIRSYSPQFAIVNLKAASTATMTMGGMPTSTSMASMSMSSGMPSMSMSSSMPSMSSMVSAAPSTHHGLSHGAYAGIGVSIAFVVLALVGAAFFLGRRIQGRRRKSLDKPEKPANQMGSLERYEDPVVEQPRMEPMRHLSLMSEMGGQEVYADTKSRHRISELPAGRTSPPGVAELDDTSPDQQTGHFWDMKKFNIRH